MQKSLIALCLAGFLINPAWAYDETKAKHYEGLFAPFADADTSKALGRIPPEKLAEWIKSGEEVVLLDVRTPAERQILSIGNTSALAMQMREVFMPENLARIPSDKKVVVVCQAGLRATLIGVALRDIGFGNVQVLKGGLIELISYLDAKTAYEPPPQK